MALAPLNRSHRVQVSGYRAQGETNRAVYQYENPRPKSSIRAPCSPLFTEVPTSKRVSRLDDLFPSVSRVRSVDRRAVVFYGKARSEVEHFIRSYGPIPNIPLKSICDSLLCCWLDRHFDEYQRFRSNDDSWFDDFWFDAHSMYKKLASENLYEEVWTLNGSWGPELWVEVGKAARPFHLRLARVFEYKPKIGSVVSHKMHAHPEDLLTPENTNDDVDLLSDYLMDKALVRRWKARSGRKKEWRTAPRPKFTNQDKRRLLRCSQQKEATFHSCSTLLQSSGFISLMNQASVSCGVPLVMFEHGMAGQNGSRIHPKPSGLKNTVRQFGSFTSITGRSRTRSKPFPPKAVRFVAGVVVEGDDGVDDEENYHYSFEPGPSDDYVGSDRFSDIGIDT